MPRTLGQLVTEVRDRLDEAAATFWSDVQIRKWINEAARDIARRSETLIKQTSIKLNTAQQSYIGPSDVIRVSRGEWQPAGSQLVYPLEYKDYNGMDSVWWTAQKI